MKHLRISVGGLADWIVRLARPRPGPMPWARAVRSAVAIAAPFALGLLLGDAPQGLLAAIGALPSATADRGGPYRVRTFRVGLAVLAAAMGFLIGGLVRGNGWLTVLAIGAVAVVSGMVSAAGAAASGAALQLLVFTIVAAGRPFPPPVWMPPLLVLAGGGWALLLLTAWWVVRREAPERDAIAAVYEAVADELDAIGSPGVEAARRNVTAALNAAHDAVSLGRLRSGGHEPALKSLVVSLNEAGPLVEAATTALRARQRPPADFVTAVRRLAAAIAAGRAVTAEDFALADPAFAGRETGGRGRAPHALYAALRAAVAALDPEAGEGEAGGAAGFPNRRPNPIRERFSEAVHDIVNAGPTARLATVRLTACIMLAEAFSEVLKLQRSYWIALTVAIVMKPDFGSVFARAVQRAVGTAIGVVVGAAVLKLAPSGLPLLVFVALFAGLLPIGVVRNYGLFSIFITPLILILIDSLAGNPSALLRTRLIDTLLGCGIVLVLGYAVWPETWHTRLPERFSTTIEEIAAYLDASLLQHSERSRLARHSYRQLSDLRTAFEQTLAEPPPVSTIAAAWWPAVIALERVLDAITATASHLQDGMPAPSAEDVARLHDAVEDLAAAARRRQAPRRLALPQTPALADLAAELNVTRDAFVRALRPQPVSRSEAGLPVSGRP